MTTLTHWAGFNVPLNTL